ncbi:MAG: 23S rRNA (guanosine(2251)-2'-O)-methyltransferase RlmB [Pseudomonadota bacterium]
MSAGNYLAGINAAEQLLRDQPDRVKRLIVDERSSNPRLAELVALAGVASRPVESRRRFQLDELAGDARHQGVVVELAGSWVLDEAALLTLVEQRLADDASVLLLALDQVTDPHNLGACLRSAAAAGVDAVIVPRTGSAELTPAARKAASGAAETLPFVRVPALGKTCERLKMYGIQVVGADGSAPDTLYERALIAPSLIVVGAEQSGLSAPVAAACDYRVAIPMAPGVESLNVSVAAALLVFEARRQRGSLAAAEGNG